MFKSDTKWTLSNDILFSFSCAENRPWQEKRWDSSFLSHKRDKASVNLWWLNKKKKYVDTFLILSNTIDN